MHLLNIYPVQSTKEKSAEIWEITNMNVIRAWEGFILKGNELTKCSNRTHLREGHLMWLALTSDFRKTNSKCSQIYWVGKRQDSYCYVGRKEKFIGNIPLYEVISIYWNILSLGGRIFAYFNYILSSVFEFKILHDFWQCRMHIDCYCS